MSKALYRKYRSKSFDEVVGQEHITDTLKNALKKGAVSHAYLFTGPRGVGKTSIARILAHAVNNLDYQDESIHLDIIEIDAASNRRIDEIRDLRDKVHIAPTSAKYKVYIIDEVHMLTREAFNALLKTLEEPPEHVIFILATTEAHKVPDTIISRTQRFNFKPIKNSQAVEHLKKIANRENLKISDSALELIAVHGKGSFRDSISILDQVAGFDKKNIEPEDIAELLGIPTPELIENVITSLSSANYTDVFESIRALRENGVDSGKACIAISEYVRDKMLEGKLGISNSSAVALLKSLLPISLSSSDFVALEVALLECMQIENSLNNKVVVSKSTTEDIKDSHIDAAIKTDSTKDINKETKNNSLEKPEKSNKSETGIKDFNQQNWKIMLDMLRKEHNTLYGILRMANISVEEDNIVLIFGFGFHKKQVDSPKNTAIIGRYLNENFGKSSFVTIIKKESSIEKDKSTESTISPQNSGYEDSLESVSNIFGGAELLES